MSIHVAVDLGAARRERDRVFRRGPFSTRSNFLATHIRQGLAFRALTRHRRLLMRSVIFPTLVAPLVSRIRQPTDRSLLKPSADFVAVALAPVVRPADVEPLATSAASQLEDNELVHPARRTKTGQRLQRPAQSPCTGCPSAGCTRGSRRQPGPSFISPPFGPTGTPREARLLGGCCQGARPLRSIVLNPVLMLAQPQWGPLGSGSLK